MQEVVRRIHRDEYKPGDPVREQDLADSLGVSRGPVREAFRMLEAKGILEFTAMRGATVARLSNEQLAESVETAAVLFGLTARLASERASAAQRDAILAAAEDLVQWIDGPATPREFFVKTVRVGQKIVAASDTSRLADLLSDYRMGWPNILGAAGFTTRQLRTRAARKWVDLATAIRDGRGRAARDLAEAVHRDVLSEALKLRS